MKQKIQIEKNKLDLAYHRRIQQQNALLIFATTGVLAFVGTFIWNIERIKTGIIISIIILSVSAFLYYKIDSELEDIVKKLDNLK